MYSVCTSVRGPVSFHSGQEKLASSPFFVAYKCPGSRRRRSVCLLTKRYVDRGATSRLPFLVRFSRGDTQLGPVTHNHSYFTLTLSLSPARQHYSCLFSVFALSVPCQCRVKKFNGRSHTHTHTYIYIYIYSVQCCFTSTETTRTIRDKEPRTSTSISTQLLGSEFVLSEFSVALRQQRPSGLLGTGSPGRPPRLSHSSRALTVGRVDFASYASKHHEATIMSEEFLGIQDTVDVRAYSSGRISVAVLLPDQRE